MPTPILVLDFDGVCHSYISGWKGADIIPDPPVEGLFEFLRAAYVKFDIAIYSSRTHQKNGKVAMIHWFLTHGPALGASYTDDMITWYRQEDGTPFLRLDFPTEKPPAFLTIDDRGWCFTGEWPNIDELLAFKPRNKR